MKFICMYSEERNLWILLDERGAELARASQFLEAKLIRGLSPRTLRAYAFDLLEFYRWPDARAVEDLEHTDLLEFIKYQREKNSSASSIKRRLVTVHAYYRFLTGKAIPQSTRVSLPAASIKQTGRDHQIGLFRFKKPSQRQLTVKTPQRLVEPLTQEQVRCFLQTLKRYRDLCIAYLMLLCGLRSREVLELELSNVNLLQRHVRVIGKGDKERIVPLPDILSSILLKYIQLERPAQAISTRLFVVLQGPRRGKAMTPEGLRSLFRHRRSLDLLSSLHPHQCRHTFGTELSRQGVSVHILQKLMGHSDVSITMQYVTLSMADVAQEYQRAAEVIEARLRGTT